MRLSSTASLVAAADAVSCFPTLCCSSCIYMVLRTFWLLHWMLGGTSMLAGWVTGTVLRSWTLLCSDAGFQLCNLLSQLFYGFSHVLVTLHETAIVWGCSISEILSVIFAKFSSGSSPVAKIDCIVVGSRCSHSVFSSDDTDEPPSWDISLSNWEGFLPPSSNCDRSFFFIFCRVNPNK